MHLKIMPFLTRLQGLDYAQLEPPELGEPVQSHQDPIEALGQPLSQGKILQLTQTKK